MLIGGPILLLAIIAIVIVAIKIKNLALKIFLIFTLAAITFPFWGYLLALLLGTLNKG